jgi:hypothetical protein
MRNILALPTTSSSSASLYLNMQIHHLYFISLKNFEFLITNFMTFSNPILNMYYILQYLHLDVRRDFFHNIHGIAIYISHSEYVLSLKMTCIVEILLLLITYR